MQQTPSIIPSVDKNPVGISRRGKILLTVSSVVFIISLSLYVYLLYFLNPNRVVTQSALHFVESSSFSFNGTIRAEYKTPNDETSVIQTPVVFTSAVSGTYAWEKEIPQFMSSITVNAGPITVSQLQLRKVANTLYVFFDTLSDFGFVDNEKVQNKWVSIDLSQLPTHYTNLSSLSLESLTLNEKLALLQRVRKSPAFLVTYKFPDEIVDGVGSYHYRLELQKDNIELYNNSLANTIEQIEFGNIEVWIRKDTQEFSRVLVTFTRKGEEVNSPSIHVFADMQLTDYNDPSLIEAPTTSVPLQDVVREVMQNFKAPISP
jgi:hypothetical protein